MGRELASALARWFALTDPPVDARLVAVADLSEPAREWFRKIPTVTQITASAQELIANPDVDIVYVAVPHQLHQQIYLQVIEGGKDLLAEKPFGIDLPAAEQISAAASRAKRFVRCSSEFPFMPGAQKVIQFIQAKQYGKLLEIRVGYHHSSDLDPNKPINWKRQVKTCGQTGVMGDLGMHTLHIPFRFGWQPVRVYAQLQKIINAWLQQKPIPGTLMFWEPMRASVSAQKNLRPCGVIGVPKTKRGTELILDLSRFSQPLPVRFLRLVLTTASSKCGHRS
jgi:predicted dehydrogenase